MFSLFKKKGTPRTERTFKRRVAEFWSWYAGVAPRFYETIEAKHCPDLAAEVSAKVDELLPGFAWVFGPGEGGNGHSFTLSGEGNSHRQLLAAFWKSQAPALAGWTFYSARQPSRDPGAGRIEIGERSFDPKAFWLTPFIEAEAELISLTVWHPLFPELDEKTRWTVLFLFLDEALGEIGTQQWIGRIEMNDTQLARAIPLNELRAFAEQTQTERGWQKGAPGELWTAYQLPKPREGEPRGDIIAGSTCLMALIDDFLESEGRLEDPLADTGAEYVYVALDTAALPKGDEVEARGKIEDAIIAALEPAASGLHIGGAIGHRESYIDLLLFDGAASLDLVQRALRKFPVPAGTSLNYFAHEKRGHRLVL